MKRLVLFVFLILLFGLALMPTAAAAPTNDHFAAAQSLVLNTKIKTTDINEAIAEFGEPATCAGDTIPHNTVWYKFTAAFTGSIMLSTAGSYTPYADGTPNADTVMSVYTGTSLATLTEVICNDDNSNNFAEIDNLIITLGTTYYVRVSAFYDEGLGIGSYYKLTTTVRDSQTYTFGTQDLDFEGTSAWILGNALNGDAHICDTGEQQSGSCAYKLIGGPLESTQLVQKVPWPTSVMLGKVDHLIAFSPSLNTSGSSINVQVQVKVIYSDGTPTSKGVRKITASTGGWSNFTTTAFLTSPNIKTVKLVIKNKSGDGTVLVDLAYIVYLGGMTRSAK